MINTISIHKWSQNCDHGCKQQYNQTNETFEPITDNNITSYTNGVSVPKLIANTISFKNQDLETYLTTTINKCKTDVNTAITQCKTDVDNKMLDFRKNKIYPVGSIYISTNSTTNPKDILGFGTCDRIEDKFLYSSKDNITEENITGGSSTVSLTESNILAHKHGIMSQYDDANYNIFGDFNKPWSVNTMAIPTYTGYYGGTQFRITYTENNTGNGSSFSIMPPYIRVYIWKRTS